MTTNEKRRVTLFLNPDLLKRAKLQAVVEEKSLTVLVENALSRYLPEKFKLMTGEVSEAISEKKGGEKI
jgi:hypothetical protein